jgi:hypothetical protein
MGEGDSQESPLTSILSLGGERKYFGCYFQASVWTLKTKSLLPSLYSPRKRWRSGQKGGIPLFGLRPIGPLARRAKRGEGRFETIRAGLG